MNHEIQHDIDVRPSHQERTETIRFNEHGILDDPFEGEERTVKLFQMAHLEDQAFRFCQFDQFLRLLEVFGDGFFEKDVDPPKQEILCDPIMERRGDGNAYGLDAIQDLGVMEEGLGPNLFGDGSGPGGIDIHHSHQFHSFHLGIFLGMELAKVTDTDDADLDLFHLTRNPPLRLLDELEEVLDLRHLGDFILFQLLQGILQGQAGAKDDPVGLLQGPDGLLLKI